MNYTPNVITWKKGDLVIHDADAKEEHMLMRVIGYTREGLCKTKYVHSPRKKYPIYLNEVKYLHDPRSFGIGVSEDED